MSHPTSEYEYRLEAEKAKDAQRKEKSDDEHNERRCRAS